MLRVIHTRDEVGKKMVTSSASYYLTKDGKASRITEEAVVIIRESDVLIQDSWHRKCKQCEKTLPISHFGATDKALLEFPGIDDFCQLCYCQ